MHKNWLPLLRLGLVNQNPFESHFAGYWRTIAANKTMKWSELSKLINRSKPMEIIYGQPMTETSMEIYGCVRGKEVVLQRPRRACPICMEHHFHTALFELEWLALCPIHRCPLTRACPQCQQEWPTLREFYKRTCSSCSASKTTRRDDVGNIRKTPETTALKRLWDIIQSVPRVPGQSSHNPSSSTQYQPPTIFFKSKKFGAYLSYYLKKSNRPADRPFIEQLIGSQSTLKARSSKLKPTSPTDNYDITPLYAERLSKTRFAAFKKVVSWTLKYFPSESSIPLFLPFAARDGEINPFSYALNIWLLHIANYPYPYRTKLSTKQYGYLSELAHFGFPSITAWTHWKTPEGSQYLLHQDFVGWIYSLDLEYCFAEIFLMLNTINSRDVYSESDNESLTKIYKRSRDELIAQRDYLEFVQNKILYYATIEPSILSYLENKFVDQNSIRISLNKGTNRNDIFAHSSDIRAPEDYKVFEHKAQFLMGRNIKLSDIERWRESENRKHREYLKTHSQTELF